MAQSFYVSTTIKAFSKLIVDTGYTQHTAYL
jgi:hypothetical protein